MFPEQRTQFPEDGFYGTASRPPPQAKIPLRIPVDESGALLTPLVEEEPLDVVAALAGLGAFQTVVHVGLLLAVV